MWAEEGGRVRGFRSGGRVIRIRTWRGFFRSLGGIGVLLWDLRRQQGLLGQMMGDSGV